MAITDKLQFFQQLEASSPASKEVPSYTPRTQTNTTTTASATSATRHAEPVFASLPSASSNTTTSGSDEFVPLKERLRRYQNQMNSDAAPTPASNQAKVTASAKVIERPFERANKLAASVASTPSSKPATASQNRPTPTAATRIHEESAHFRSGSAAAAGPLANRLANYTASVSQSHGQASSSAPKPLSSHKTASTSNSNLNAGGGKKCEVCSKTGMLLAWRV